MAEDEDFRARQAAAIDDAGVVQFVRDDEIFLAENSRDRARVRREARLKDHAGFHVLEVRDLLLQFHVNLHRARDGADRTRPHAVLARRRECRLAQLGVSGQAEVVVGGEVDDLFAVEGALRGLLVLEHAQVEMSALGLKFVQLVGEIRERISAGCGRHFGLKLRALRREQNMPSREAKIRSDCRLRYWLRTGVSCS